MQNFAEEIILIHDVEVQLTLITLHQKESTRKGCFLFGGTDKPLELAGYHVFARGKKYKIM